MNTNPAISILVPVYKVEAYLQRCIDSVLAQDFQEWEMILVDDGSPDHCPQICDEAAQKDTRISVVHKENGGLPSARRAGFAVSRGKYIMHVDSDDWLMPSALSTLYNYAENGQYDIVRGGNRRVHEDGGYTVEMCRKIGMTCGSEECLINVISLGFLPYLWGAIYRRELFCDSIFERVKGFSIGEDWVTNIAVAKNVKTILCVEDIVYNYFINTNSYMQSKVCSHEYGIRLQKYLTEITNNSSERVKLAVKVNNTIGCISDLFIPELRYKKDNYNLIKENCKNPIIRKQVIERVDKKFLLFIEYPIIYKIYTRLYCLLFKFQKLNGKSRIVIE